MARHPGPEPEEASEQTTLLNVNKSPSLRHRVGCGSPSAPPPATSSTFKTSLSPSTPLPSSWDCGGPGSREAGTPTGADLIALVGDGLTETRAKGRPAPQWVLTLSLWLEMGWRRRGQKPTTAPRSPLPPPTTSNTPSSCVMGCPTSCRPLPPPFTVPLLCATAWFWLVNNPLPSRLFKPVHHSPFSPHPPLHSSPGPPQYR
ncbi:hypothetical protein K474DRAFT_1680994 [Panus rudis PR-1116 ss-1]|nr:hypothetical protein K474DRAFT_1680994 [Panus rudis PR-1116 ss-1]